MSTTTNMTRLFFLAVDLRPSLPPSKLMNMLGRTWGPIIAAGAEHGLGAAVSLPKAAPEQIQELLLMGAEAGPGDLAEFRALLSASIYENICGNDGLSTLDQMRYSGELYRWYDGRNSANGDGVYRMDAEIDVPPFTKTGLWPLDRICGSKGVPQEVITVLARPETGKTSFVMALGCEWKRQQLGPVSFIQTELSPSAVRMKWDGMTGTEQLWDDGDVMVFGRRAAEQELLRVIEQPDPGRLIIFDSVGGHCGQGDTPDSRNRFADLYDLLMQAKNSNRMAVAAAHVKRGVDLMDIESAAGSSAVERFSGVLVCLTKDDTPRPDGSMEVRIETVKNRYHSRVRPFRFLFDFVRGKASELDEVSDRMEALV